MTPRAVLLRTGLKPLSTAKSVYTAHPKPTMHCARPKTYFYKLAQSTIQRPFDKNPALTNRHFNHKVNTVRPRIVNTARSYRTPVNTVRPRVVNTARPNRTSVNVARANGFNAIKPSACWVWRPIKPNSKPQLDDKGFVNSECSRHMIGNIAYLSNFKQIDGGYVAFGGGAYGGKFLLPDENHILLKIPRKDNMYSFDMKNIVPKESLTCLVAKATLDESMLWHRRHGHINFKNINKLVKDNLVRGLPTKHFENDQTCVACLKGKQHRASCTVSNDSAGTSKENSQDCIVMPIWKDTSYFDSPTKNVDNGEPKTANDAQKQVEDGLNNENAEQERFADDSSSKDVNAVGKQVNTASPDVNTGSLKLNVVGPSVSTASPNEEDNTEEEPEVDLGNITNSYIVPTTPNTRIHKDHPIDNVIGEVQSTVQTEE
ncbi:ribonuclease H-like domain-containing protein [Tanacetum coccineum]